MEIVVDQVVQSVVNFFGILHRTQNNPAGLILQNIAGIFLSLFK